MGFKDRKYSFQYFKKLARKPSVLDRHEAFIVKHYLYTVKHFPGIFMDMLGLENLNPKYLCFCNDWQRTPLIHCCIDSDNPILWKNYVYGEIYEQSFYVGFELHDTVEALCTRKNKDKINVWDEGEIFKIFTDYMVLRCKRNGYKFNKRDLTLKRVSFCRPQCDMSEDIQLLNIYTYYLKRKKNGTSKH